MLPSVPPEGEYGHKVCFVTAFDSISIPLYSMYVYTHTHTHTHIYVCVCAVYPEGQQSHLRRTCLLGSISGGTWEPLTPSPTTVDAQVNKAQGTCGYITHDVSYTISNYFQLPLLKACK